MLAASTVGASAAIACSGNSVGTPTKDMPTPGSACRDPGRQLAMGTARYIFREHEGRFECAPSALRPLNHDVRNLGGFI
jgi:hypothetical protein